MVLLYGITIFLSAFLLFAVQPMVAKVILPWFGGAAAVWSTCMLFFQAVLLLGYLYAHWLTRLRPRAQALLHGGLLAASLATLPILPNRHSLSFAVPQPSLRVLALLALSVGAPYFLLSSTTPLLQAWYARAYRHGMPYRLFALSNFASLAALLTYPVVVEPALATHTQGIAWSAAYICFAAVCATAAWRASAHPPEKLEMPAGTAAPPGWSVRLLWLALAASASTLLLAVSAHVTQDVAPVPFLWVLPLSAYLLSFIICFEAPRLYARSVFIPLFALSLAFMAFRLWPDARYVQLPLVHLAVDLGTRGVVVAFATSLFVCCMVCHGEVARLKPPPRYLTGFYVMVSLGGALGGVFVGLVAPNLFRAAYEFPIGLAVCAVAASVAARPRHPAALAAVAAALCAYLLGIGVIMRDSVKGFRIVDRNFYGLLRVYDDGNPEFDEYASRKFVHGIIEHGEQMFADEYRDRPGTYFCPESGVGRAMRALEGAPRRIGIVGLGCGTLAAYGRRGDSFRIYEINPLVIDIARREFTYLRDSPARIELTLGDGRLALESEPPQGFDLLVMDAFSGDSVPVHLLTLEAFREYFRHIKPQGILAVNISNRHLDLQPVIERAAASLGKVALAYQYTPPAGENLCFACSWALVMDRAAEHAHPDLLSGVTVLTERRPFRVWTDDYSSMFGILK